FTSGFTIRYGHDSRFLGIATENCLYVKRQSVKVSQLSSVQAHNPCRLCVCNAFIYEQLRSTAKNFAFSPGKPSERDTIYGDANANTILGLGGNDLLEGGGGAD